MRSAVCAGGAERDGTAAPTGHDAYLEAINDGSGLLSALDAAQMGLDQLKVPRSVIPAVTHVDYTARLQTVHEETNPKFHALLSRFYDKTGCPVLVNTSFNVRGEPIVCTPEQAFKCFMGTELDVLVIGNLLLLKEDQDPTLRETYQDHYELD